MIKLGKYLSINTATFFFNSIKLKYRKNMNRYSSEGKNLVPKYLLPLFIINFVKKEANRIQIAAVLFRLASYREQHIGLHGMFN